jgi:flagellar basal body-associated protein FliL
MSDYDYNYNYDEGQQTPESKVHGYKIAIIVMALILVVMSIMVWVVIIPKKDAGHAMEKELLLGQFDDLMGEYDNLQTTNDTLNMQMAAERLRVDSVMLQLSKERTLSANKIRQYEKEVATLRTVMRGYVSTIDSLNTLNTRLIGENRDMRQQVTTERLRADRAEETNEELATRVRQGSVIRARDIRLMPMSNNDRDLQRVNRATQLRVDFVLSANELAQPGGREVYVRVMTPDGYLLANEQGAVFTFEDESRAYTAVREIDYQNQDLSVSLYYKGSGITSGTYRVEVYMDGYLAGSSEINLR